MYWPGHRSGLLNSAEFKLQTGFDLRLDVFEVRQGVLNINHLLL